MPGSWCGPWIDCWNERWCGAGARRKSKRGARRRMIQLYLLAAGQVMAEFVRRPLAAAGHEVTTFSTVEACRVACLRAPPRVLMIARRVAGDDGLDAAETLRSC